MVVPCMVNSWLYVSAVTKSPSGAHSWIRMISASMPPMTKKTREATKYITPIRL